jgi:hypothetical protein
LWHLHQLLLLLLLMDRASITPLLSPPLPLLLATLRKMVLTHQQQEQMVHMLQMPLMPLVLLQLQLCAPRNGRGMLLLLLWKQRSRATGLAAKQQQQQQQQQVPAELMQARAVLPQQQWAPGVGAGPAGGSVCSLVGTSTS